MAQKWSANALTRAAQESLTQIQVEMQDLEGKLTALRREAESLTRIIEASEQKEGSSDQEETG